MNEARGESRRNNPDSVDERLRRSPATPNQLDGTDESQKAADITRAGGAGRAAADATGKRPCGTQRQDLMSDEERCPRPSVPPLRT